MRHFAAAILCLLPVGPAAALITVDVNPQTTTAGTPVNVFGISNCEIVVIDFGDGSSPAVVPAGPFSVTHVYTQPSPDPPGIWLVTAQGQSCATQPSTAVISVIVNPGAGQPPPPPPGAAPGSLLIERATLRFENDRAAIRVRQNEENLQVFADLQYDGTGLLQGYWEVDGAIWSFVNRHLVFGKTLTIASPTVPGLPTIQPGLHRVRLVLTRPSAGFTPPLALYFAGFDPAPLTETLRLLNPQRESALPFEEHNFEWTRVTSTGSYQVSFFDAQSTEPVFSAFSNSAGYRLPDGVLNGRFVPGRRYEWQVTAFDAEGLELTQSTRQPFVFQPLDAFVPAQLVVITAWSIGGEQVVARLRTTYGLRELLSERLQALDLRVTLFETMSDVQALARTLSAEEGVLLAQPNFILRTMSEPQSGLQKLHEGLNFEVLHRNARGRDVRVAIIDTGVDRTHVELKDRVVVERNFVRGGRSAAEIHGTAVAGVIAASLNDVGIAGIAPEAQLLTLRACRQLEPGNPRASCDSFDVARALDTALMERARIVNMSFGSEQPIALIQRLIEAGAQSGVWFVAPVGNAGWQRHVAFPASHPAVIAVAGNDETGRAYPNDLLYRRSRVVAPATHVFSSVPGDRYNFLNGTSLSSAIVTGLIAVTLEQRSLTAAELPPRQDMLCSWTERLTHLSLCKQQTAAAPAATHAGAHAPGETQH